jgi:hypothetical protein
VGTLRFAHPTLVDMIELHNRRTRIDLRMPTTTPKSAPYGSWKSPITSDLIVAQATMLSDVRLDGDHIYWLEGRPQ